MVGYSVCFSLMFAIVLGATFGKAHCGGREALYLSKHCLHLFCVLPIMLFGSERDVFCVRGWNRFVLTTRNYLSRLNLLCTLYYII